MNEPNYPFNRSSEEPASFSTGKEWYESQTIKSALIAIGTGIVPVVSMGMMAFGVNVDIETQELMVNFILMLISLGFAGGTIRGRLKAHEEIKPRTQPPPSGNQQGCSTVKFTVALLASVLLCTLVLLHSVNARAVMKDAIVSFEAPTKRVDGSALPPSEIKHYLVKWTGPSSTSGIVITSVEKSLWTPPKIGEYSLTISTVDTEGRVSNPSTTVKHVATEIPPGPAPLPPTPTFPVTLTPVIAAPPLVTVEGLRVLAQSHTSNTGWLRETVADRKVIKAPPGPLNTADPSQNARVDYVVRSDGGAHTVSFQVFAPDGLSDSLWLGLNGKPAPTFNKVQPVFFPAFGKWVRSTPLPIDLPAGQVTLSLFAREPGLLIADIELKKVLKP